MIDIDRTRDTELLRQIAKIQDAELRRLQIENLVLRRENAALKGASPDEIEAKIAEFEKQLAQNYEKTRLGTSERRPRNDKPKKPKQAQKGHGPTPQPTLAIEHVEHDLDEADKVCLTCGGDLAPFDGQSVESEEIDVVGVQYVLKKHRRKKYRCPCGCSIQTADMPNRLVPGGRYSTEFAIRCVYDKFDGHLPFERQVRRMARTGLKTSTQALWDQSLAVAGCFSRQGEGRRGNDARVRGEQQPILPPQRPTPLCCLSVRMAFHKRSLDSVEQQRPIVSGHLRILDGVSSQRQQAPGGIVPRPQQRPPELWKPRWLERRVRRRRRFGRMVRTRSAAVGKPLADGCRGSVSRSSTEVSVTPVKSGADRPTMVALAAPASGRWQYRPLGRCKGDIAFTTASHFA